MKYSISPPIKFSAISGIFAEKSPQMKIILSHFIILAIQYTYGTLIWGIVHVCSSWEIVSKYKQQQWYIYNHETS